MDWLDKEIAEQWRKEGQRYASDVNAFVHKMLQESIRMNLSCSMMPVIRSVPK